MSNSERILSNNQKITDNNTDLETIITRIKQIPAPLDTSDATATADDILAGKTAYVNGIKLVGSLEKMSNEFNDYKVICCGDSLTCGDYGSEPEGTANTQEENYPYFLAKYLGKENKVDVINLGVNGSTPATWYSKFNENKALFEFATNKRIVVTMMFGANGGFTDTIENDTSSGDYNTYANTVVGYYCREIEEIIKLSKGMAQIIIFGAPYVNPNKRSRYYNNVLTANPISKKIAQKYNLCYVDTFNELGLSKLNTNKWQPIDGLHFGYNGYSKLGTFIGSKIKASLSFNYDDPNYNPDTDIEKINIDFSKLNQNNFSTLENGTTQTFQGWYTYDNIDVEGYDNVIYKKVSAYDESGVILCGLSFVDSNNRFISGITPKNADSYTKRTDDSKLCLISGETNIPNGAKYLRVTIFNYVGFGGINAVPEEVTLVKK